MDGRGRRNVLESSARPSASPRGSLRSRLMMVGLGVCQVMVALLGAVFSLVVRPQIVAASARVGGGLDGATALALSAWFVPATTAAGLLCTIVAMVAPFKRSRRVSVTATGLVVSALALVFAGLASVRYVLHGG